MEILFMAQLSISHVQLMDSVLLIYNAKAHLDGWKLLMHQEQVSNCFF